MKKKFSVLLLLIILSACAPNFNPTGSPQVLEVYATPATQPWMAKLYDCAARQSTVVRLVDSPSSAVIYLRIGTPDHLITPAYQIDTENLVVATHRQNPLQNLDISQVRAVFAGQGDQSVQVWVYSNDNDIQQVFDAAVMQGVPITSLAHLAATPQQMSDDLNNDVNAVGILPQHWKAGDSRSVYTISNIPVLAITKEDPKGMKKDLIACLQK